MASSADVYKVVAKIDNRLTAMEAVQKERHEQNKEDMTSIGNLSRSVEKHCHELGKLKVHRAIHWVALAAIVAALIIK